MWCSVLTNPLRDGLNLSSSLVLDVAAGQLGPLSLSAFALLPPFSVNSVLLSGFWFFLVSRTSLCIFPLFMALKPFELMFVRFLFRLYRFTFCNCAWSSLFGVSMNVQGVATCPLLNSASLLRRFISSITSWMKSFLHRGGQTDSKSLQITAYSFVDSASSIGRDLSRPIWGLQIRRHTHVPRG